jgi:hypothetical protein
MKKILIIEDDADIAEALQMHLLQNLSIFLNWSRLSKV